MQLSVASVQLNVLQGNIEANLKSIEEKIKNASLNKQDIAILPQYAIAGYPSENVMESLKSKHDYIMNVMSNYAKLYNIHIVFGMTINTADRFIDRAIYINKEGEYIDHYDRIHKFWREDKCQTGDSYKIIEIEGIKIGLMMGDDIYYPELSSTLRKNGADAVICLFYGNNHRLGNAFEFKDIIDNLVVAHGVVNEIDFILTSAKGRIQDDDNQLIIVGGEVIGKTCLFSISEGKMKVIDEAEDIQYTTIDKSKINFYRMLGRRFEGKKKEKYENKFTA